MKSQAVFSSTNAVITIAGNECGRIQDITITQNLNLQKFTTLYNKEYQSFVPGVPDILVSAQKAFVEYDTFLTTVSSFAQSASNLLFGNVFNMRGNNKIAQLLNLATDVVSPVIKDPNFNPCFDEDRNNLSNVIDLINKGIGSIGDLFAMVNFDIEIARPYQTSQSPLNSLFSVERVPSPVWRLEGCQLNSRSINLNVGRVVIMENLSINAKRFYDVEITNVKQIPVA